MPAEKICFVAAITLDYICTRDDIISRLLEGYRSGERGQARISADTLKETCEPIINNGLAISEFKCSIPPASGAQRHR